MSEIKIIKGDDLESWRADHERSRAQNETQENERLYGHLLSTVNILVRKFPHRKDDIISKIHHAKAD